MIRINSKVRPVGFPPVSKTLPQAVKKLVKELKPEKIILFGSYAYGNPTPDSDVDLLVIMKTNAKPKERYLMVSRVLIPRQFPVDIIIRTPEEIERALKNRDNFFTREIISRGKVLYEQKNEFEIWIDHAEDDFNAAQKLIRGKKPSIYGACFHAQQCAEKYESHAG